MHQSTLHHRRRWLACLTDGWRLAWPVVAMLLGLLTLWSASARAGNLPGELPSLVGRIHVLSGELQLHDRDHGGWQRADDGAVHNWPVAAGDRLRLLGRDARADLRMGSTTLRLGPDAQLWLQQLDEQAVLLHLQGGTVALRLAAVDGDAFGPVELRTREGRWVPRRPGHYRFDRATDATQASVWRGELQFEGFDSALTISERRRADLWLDSPEPGRRSATRYAWAPVERDDFADWVARDERQDDAPLSARHVPPGMTGWQDLDRHGDWVSDPDHGALWLPRAVAPGWAPFQVGRWAWVAPWGWTWIDAAPWGFAPFHYGNWVRYGGHWAWSPGPRGPRVRYAPALQAWIGGAAVGITMQRGGHRPPPPRVVVPAVPVVVVRPSHPHHRPPVVVGPRPDWHGVDPAPPHRRDDHRFDRRDGRTDGRTDGRHDPRGEHRAVPRPLVRAEAPAEVSAPSPLQEGPGRADRAPQRPEGRATLREAARGEGSREGRETNRDTSREDVRDGPRRDAPRGGPGRVSDRDLAR